MRPNAEIEWITVTDTKGNSLEVSRFPVTVRQFRRFVEGGGYMNDEFWGTEALVWRIANSVVLPSYWGDSAYSDDGSLPVTGVCFWEAETVATWFGARLPSENEWVWIATNCGSTIFPWGDDPVGPDRAHYTSFLAPTKLVPVDSHPLGASKEGVEDLVGNVCEWCYPGGIHDLGSKDVAVLKGGSSWHTAENLGPQFRDLAPVTRRDNDTGFRLVRGSFVSTAEVEQLDQKRYARILPSRARSAYSRPTAAFRQEALPAQMDLDSWRLSVSGEVQSEREFSLDEIRTLFPICEEVGFLTCVCKWSALISVRGVRIADLLRMVGVRLPLRELFLNSFSLPGVTGKRYNTSNNIASLQAHGALLVFELNGKLLGLEDGYPLRTLDFHTFGYKHVKAVQKLVVSSRPEPGWWESSKGYGFDGTIMPGTYTLIGDPARCIEVFDSGRIKIDPEDPSFSCFKAIRTHDP